MNTKTSPSTKRAPQAPAPAGSRPAKRAAAAAAAEPTVAEVVAIAEAVAEAVATPATPVAKPRTVAITSGECTCRTCARTRPVTKFPTKAANKDGSVDRDDQCRECRDAKRLAKNPSYPRKAA